jgi:hypothetical protein
MGALATSKKVRNRPIVIKMTEGLAHNEFATILRRRMAEAEGTMVCVDENKQIIDQGGLHKPDITRVDVGLGLALELDANFDLKSGIVFGNDIDSIVRHLKDEHQHVVFIDEAESIFDLPWCLDNVLALDRNRNILILSTPSIWMLPKHIMDRIGFRLRIDNRQGSVSLWSSPHEEDF